MIPQFAHDLAQYLGLNAGAWGFWIALALRVLVVATLFLGGISLLAMFSIWWERKVAGHMQCRLGPMHTGRWHGWAQSIADGAKLFLKEDLVPAGADKLLFRMAPYVAFMPVFAAFLALPFGPQLTFETGLNIGVLYLLAVLSVEVMGVILAGWASNNKWSIYGAMREACQMVSYEIPLGIAILCGVLTAGTLNLSELSYLQGAGVWDWFVFHNPFIFAAFVIYFIASLASNKRAPFDLPESESELVAGFHTEYSGLRWAYFFFAEYAAMFVVGAIQAVLFLGAWNSPLGRFDPIHALLGYDPVAAGQAYFSGTVEHTTTLSGKVTTMGLAERSWLHPGVQLLLLNAYCMFWFVVKAMGVMFVQIWLRWTLPRIRIDQVLHACVKVLLPASLVVFLGVAGWVWLVPQPPAGLVRRSGELAAQYGAQEAIPRLGHLTGSTPLLQGATQIVLTALGLLVAGACLGVLVWAFIRRTRHPKQSFFAEAMPVGNEIHFGAGKPETPASGSAEPA